ncbi:methyltransferase domain-containing protein [Cetobacterium somerae]|uniref:methyltransferase domain-containing protein n=1 Tax=Cetobacterium sp. NK01 TaxID=2993530 RepID=UPI002115F1B9|nr:methyltransferase domain-containing protein [Cetobacterium sp. NK01]MCQ8212370.1 methyltransferase domain-containing protein [Cetobacterium sp. NK01]
MVKKMNFEKQFKNYDYNAITQKKVAEKLLTFIDNSEKYDTILELGCGTGVFTKTLCENLKFNHLDLNDIFNTQEFFKDIAYRNFFIENMELLELKKYSLIVSSSAFQWVDDLETLIQKISKNTSQLIFSIYSKGNLIEILNHFGVSLNYKSTNEIYKILKKYYTFVKFQEDEFILEFPTPLKALKHLKETGVTGFSSSSYSLTKSFKSTLLTYKVSYFSCKN